MQKAKIWKLWDNGQVNAAEVALLRRKADELTIPFDAAGQKDIKTLIKAFLERDDALGLAAPQIGISKRAVIFKNKNLDSAGPVRRSKDYDVLINPRITQYRGQQVKMSEGCLSCPDISVEVTRFSEIKVKAFDQFGNMINKHYSDFLARVVQHEVDHLEGKLITDHGGSIFVPQAKQDFFQKLFKS